MPTAIYTADGRHIMHSRQCVLTVAEPLFTLCKCTQSIADDRKWQCVDRELSVRIKGKLAVTLLTYVRTYVSMLLIFL